METFENYKDIIDGLATLKTIKPDSNLQHRLRNTLMQKRTPAFLSPFRIALSALVILFFAGGSAALASDAKPGELLYPVKKAINTLVNEVTEKPEETKRTPTASFQAPTPTTAQPVEETTQAISQQPTPTPTIKPSVAIPPGQSVQATADVNKGQMIKQTLGVSASVSIPTQNETTPTQKPEEGNSNTASNKESSILPIQPEIDINLKEKPVIHIGL